MITGCFPEQISTRSCLKKENVILPAVEAGEMSRAEGEKFLNAIFPLLEKTHEAVMAEITSRILVEVAEGEFKDMTTQEYEEWKGKDEGNRRNVD